MQLGSTIGLYGAERWILALIKHLDKSTIETWVTAIKDEPGTDALLCKQAEKFGFHSAVFESFDRWNFSAVKKLKQFISRNGINILHTHGYKTDLIGLLATMGTACKIVSTPHGWTQQPDFKLFVYEILDRLIFLFFDAVVPLSDELYRQALRIPGVKNKLYLIRNGVDIAEIDTVQDVSKEVDIWKKEDVFIIGYIGRLTPGKGLDILLKALAYHGEPDWRIAVVGEGEQLSELQSMAQTLNIESRVKFFGFRPDRLAFLRGFDVFVLPSRSEGIPRCLMEAMVAGVPVVASDIPGCRYLVDGTTTGLLVDVDMPQKLADSLRRLRSDFTLWDGLSKDGRKFIQQHFSAARMAKEYQKLYHELV